MFAFLPLTKAARTERSPVETTELLNDVSQLSAPSVAAMDPFTINRVRPLTMAEAEIRVGSVSVRPSAFLTGIGVNSCWMVDENTRLLRVWDMRKPFWNRTAPRVARIPSFTEDEGLPLFIAELGPDDESLAFCTDYGAVSSLDRSVEFQFSDEVETIQVSAFACRREGQAMFTAVGTFSGRVLVAIKVNGERFIVDFERTTCDVTVRTSISSSVSSWWRSLLPKRSANTDDGGNSFNSSSTGNLEFTILRFRKEQSGQIWAVNAASEFFLLDVGSPRRHQSKNCATGGNGGIKARWITNISAVLQRQGRVVTFDETPLSLCCLVYLFPSSRADASLEVVTIDPGSGFVRQVVSMRSIGLLAHSVSSVPLHHTYIHLDESTHTITVLSGKCCVFLNNEVGVRAPCSSEDVHTLKNVDCPIVSSLLPDGHIVTLAADGPVVSAARASELMVDAAESSRKGEEGPENGQTSAQKSNNAWMQSRFTGVREGHNDMARLLSNLLDTLRVDSKISIDSAVLEVSEAICSCTAPHKGNWARADLDVEDENIVTHVTHSVVQRQQDHRRFMFTVLLHKEIADRLQPRTIAQLISMQEALLAMLAIRRLQNDASHQSFPATSTVEGFEMVVPLYRLAVPSGNSTLALNLSQGGDSCSVEGYRQLVRSAVERERCQRLLREAINQIAKRVRSELTSVNPTYAQATSAEIVFGDPSRLCGLLSVLGERLDETQVSVIVDRQTKFEMAMAIASVFVLVARAIDESRDDVSQLYAISQNVRALLWTSSGAENYGIETQMYTAATCLANALADASVWSSTSLVSSFEPKAVANRGGNTSEYLSWCAPLQDQLRLLDLIALVLHFVFRNHSKGSPSFYASLMRCTLFREPFLREPLGYPFGLPVPSSGTTLGTSVLRVCEELALEFVVDDVICALCLAEPVDDPLQQKGKYERLGHYCERNPRVCEIALHALLVQRREWEIQLLPELVPTFEPAESVRDAFLHKEAPHLVWLMKPTVFSSLVEEGKRLPSTSSFFLFGDDLVTHRSRCLSLAKLAWVAAGAETSTTYYSLELDAALVKAQRSFLMPNAKDVVLGPAELVQRLLKLSLPDAWVSATEVTCLVEEELRRDLLAQILRRSKQHDGMTLLQMQKESTSELELSRALESTATGRILLAVVARDVGRLSEVMEASASVLQSEEKQLLLSWLKARMSGQVA